jgi:hypothetical protein
MSKVFGSSQWQRKTGLPRALVWLRKALATEDAIDEFISYWLALEALDGLIPRNKELLRVKCNSCKSEIGICPICGEDPKAWATTAPLFGAEQLAIECGISAEEFRRLKILRGKVFHAAAALRAAQGDKSKPLITFINEETSKLRNVVIYGICRILNLSSEQIEKISAQTPIKVGQTARLRLKTTIQDFKINQHNAAGYPVHPDFNWSVWLTKIEKLPGKKLNVRFRSTSKPLNCKWPAKNVFECEIIGNLSNLEKAELINAELSHDE